MFNNTDTREHEEIDILQKETEVKNLIVFNDDINTFDHVIETLIKICKHDPIQAEQCTFIIHYNGKCAVKSGEYKDLEPMCTAILDRGITAEIQ